VSARKLNPQQVQRILTRVPFNRMLGMRLFRMHEDGITLACRVREELRNSAGIAHGGVAAAMADAAVGIAIQRHFGGGRAITTVEMKVNYFQPIARGNLFARSHLLQIGCTLCVGLVDLSDAGAHPVGTALVTYMFLDRLRDSQATPSGKIPGRRGRTHANRH
jgi:uncharacterized protein (TIGR00369 family)